MTDPEAGHLVTTAEPFTSLHAEPSAASLAKEVDYLQPQYRALIRGTRRSRAGGSRVGNSVCCTGLAALVIGQPGSREPHTDGANHAQMDGFS